MTTQKTVPGMPDNVMNMLAEMDSGYDHWRNQLVEEARAEEGLDPLEEGVEPPTEDEED